MLSNEEDKKLWRMAEARFKPASFKELRAHYRRLRFNNLEEMKLQWRLRRLQRQQ